MNKILATVMLGAISSMNALAMDKTISVTLTNPSDSRKAVPVVIPVSRGEWQSAHVTDKDGFELPTQIDDLNNDGQPDELSFVIFMKKKEKMTLNIVLSEEPRKEDDHVVCNTFGYMAIRDRDKQAKKPKHQQIYDFTFPATTNPYNYIFPHGAVLESNLVGFRVYADHRQSIDMYGHKRPKCDIAETMFYPSAEQKAAGSGDDVLYTGSTYGCGALHGWDGEKAIMFENVRNTTMRIVATGPVRTIVETINRGWKPVADALPVDVTTRYTIYADHRDVEAKVTFSRPVGDIPLSTGIVDIVEGSEEYTDKAGLRGCWGTACAGNNPKVYDTHTVGLGIYTPKEYYTKDAHFTDGKEHLPNQAYAQVLSTAGDNLHYWFTATCDMESYGFKNKKAWFKYLESWKKELDNPVKIEITNISR